MARADWELDQGYFLAGFGVLGGPATGGIAACLGRRVLQFVQLYTDTDAIILNMAMGGGVGCIFQGNWRRPVIRVLCFLLPS